MLKNYLVVAVRNLLKHKAYSFINITGLAFGLACFILILLFVRDERSFDFHHERHENIYRVVIDVRTSNGFQTTAQSPPAWGPDLQKDYPEVASFVRMKPPNQKWMVGLPGLQFYEKGVAFVDSTVFDVFTIPMVRGNPDIALNAPYKMVISESMAAKYFGNEDPMGKMLSFDSQYQFEITGIMEDMPRNGHFQFGFLPSISTLTQAPIYGDINFLNLQFPQLYTYVLLNEGMLPSTLEAKFPEFIERYMGAQFPLEEAGFEVDAFLQPLSSIHLRSHRENEIAPNGDIKIIYLFLAIAFFILIIASINFMNLATARSASRAKEVGMRKVVGAMRASLIGQFLSESVLLGLMALIIAVLLVWLSLSEFNALTSKAISARVLLDPGVILRLVGIAVVVGLLAGSYPAFFLSSFRPAAVLKGNLSAGGGAFFRKTLIIFQFGISIMLIISTGIVFNQIDYARNKKLGFEKEHVVNIQLTDPTPRAMYRTYRQIISQLPNIVSVSASSSAPAGVVNEGQLQPVGAPADEHWLVKSYFSDFDFVETMGIELLDGRTLSPAFPADTLLAGFQGGNQTETVVTSVVLNEAAIKAFGWSDPSSALGEQIQFVGGANLALQVVGVMRDFHNQSVHERISPTMITFANEQAYTSAIVRIRPGSIAQTLASLEQTWNELLPNYAFEYTFLDDDFDGLYKADALIGSLLSYFAVLTIFIACLGLFGLASFTAQQRTMEIGVRKSMGASVMSIVLLLSKEFTVLIGIAFVPAVLFSFLFMQNWLAGFAYRIEIMQVWWIFVTAGVGALAIAWLSVSYKSIKAALTNPVDALRRE